VSNTDQLMNSYLAHWSPFLDWAERLGLALLPVRTDDTKKPAIKWKENSSHSRAKWQEWLAGGRMTSGVSAGTWLGRSIMRT
jgi:hypothetical protein